MGAATCDRIPIIFVEIDEKGVFMMVRASTVNAYANNHARGYHNERELAG